MPGNGLKRVVYLGNKSIDVPKGAEVKKLPILSSDRTVSPYFGIVFNEKLSIPPHSETKVYVNLPVDLGVFITDGKAFKHIDTVENWPKKFSLYGSASDGMVYRYFKCDYHTDVPKAEKNTITTAVEVLNKHNKWFIMTKAIFQYPSFNLFAIKDKVVGETVDVVINNEGFILVSLKNKSYLAQAKSMPHIRQDYGSTNEMRYGL